VLGHLHEMVFAEESPDVAKETEDDRMTMQIAEGDRKPLQIS